MANLVFDFLHNYKTGERRASDPADAYQYDEGHVFEAVVPVAVTSCEIHYWARGFDEAEAYTPASITQNTDNSYTITGSIPNKYFETYGDLRVYIVVTDGSASITTYEGRIHICERAMPDDYVDDDPDNEAVQIIAAARGYAETSEAWAVGQINGEDVPSTADQYQNNASYYAGQAASAASSAAAQASLAPAYDNTATYEVGDYCLYSGQLYECNTAILTAEAWTAAHWTAVTVGGELATVKDGFDDLKEDLDKYDSPFVVASNIPAYTNGIKSIKIIADGVASYEAYRVTTIRKNRTWHWYMDIKGYNGSSWVLVDSIESAYIEGAEYPRVETLESKYHKYTVTIDWNYVRSEDISASSLTIDLKNDIVYSPFVTALANIKTAQTNIATLTANEQIYNSVFAVAVPNDILGLVDITIYNPVVSNYEKYRLRNIRHNSSWHIQLTVQGYNGSEWVNVDEVEVAASAAPSPVPAVEVYDSKYHRLTVTIVWALMGNSVTRTSLDYELKHSVINKTQIALRQDTNRALVDATIPPFELTDHVDRTKVVTVKKDGSGDYTSISAAYAAITDSAFDNQYEIIVYPGTYNENNLMPPPYTHTHGIFPKQTIVDSTGSDDVDNSVFDMGHAPCKLSNMWIKSATKYCVHQDVELYAVTLICENLYCEKLPGGSQLSSACVGMGADFGGAKFIWRGCTFINGEVGMHTNPNQDPNANQHLIFEDCTFVNAYVWLGVAGNTYGEYVCDIRGCKTNKGNAGMRLKFGAPISGIPVNFPWQIIGGNNNLAPQFDNTSDTSVTDDWVAINTTEKKQIVATESITKGKFVSDNGAVCNASTPKQNVVGMAVASGSTGNVIPVWSGAFPYIGTAGEYGIDANGELSVSASTKIGYIFNNIFYPY